MTFFFEKLDVYQKSLQLSVDLSKIASDYPYKYHRIQSQLIGSAISVPLNIVEGKGRVNKKEKIQYLRIAQASAFELIPISEICEGLKLAKKKTWLERIEEICKMLSSLINTISKD